MFFQVGKLIQKIFGIQLQNQFGYFQIQDTYLQSNNVILPRSSAQNTIQQRSNIPLIFPQL